MKGEGDVSMQTGRGEEVGETGKRKETEESKSWNNREGNNHNPRGEMRLLPLKQEGGRQRHRGIWRW